jgi:hypothetical protein
MTRGTVVVDWHERYDTAGKVRKAVKIVTKINSDLMIELMTKSVLDE